MPVSEIPALSTKGDFRPGLAVPKIAAGVILSGGPMLPREKNLRYVPLRCHFLHFEITVNRK